MNHNNIILHRLVNQQLAAPSCKTPQALVAHQGAVQAQDYAGAKWAIGLRLPQLTDADVEQAFQQGDLIRTHILRPTWHFVSPADLRWMLQISAPRVQTVNGSMYRNAILDPEYTVDEGRGMLSHVIILRGKVAGSWQRSITKAKVNFHLKPFRKLNEADQLALERQMQHYARFYDSILQIA